MRENLTTTPSQSPEKPGLVKFRIDSQEQGGSLSYDIPLSEGSTNLWKALGGIEGFKGYDLKNHFHPRNGVFMVNYLKIDPDAYVVKPGDDIIFCRQD